MILVFVQFEGVSFFVCSSCVGTTFREGHSPATCGLHRVRGFIQRPGLPPPHEDIEQKHPVTYEVILGDIFLQQGVMYTCSLIGMDTGTPQNAPV